MLNKLDLVPEDERTARVKAFVTAYRWKGPVFAIAAISGDGCRALTFAIQDWLDAHPAHAMSGATDVVPGRARDPLLPATTTRASGATTTVVLTPAPVAPRRRRAAKKGDT